MILEELMAIIFIGAMIIPGMLLFHYGNARRGTKYGFCVQLGFGFAGSGFLLLGLAIGVILGTARPMSMLCLKDSKYYKVSAYMVKGPVSLLAIPREPASKPDDYMIVRAPNDLPPTVSCIIRMGDKIVPVSDDECAKAAESRKRSA